MATKRYPRAAFLLLSATWIASQGSHAIDFGRILRRNENNSVKRRLSEVSEPHNNVIHGHDAAATGTVVTPDFSQHHGMNACDAQMAKSLVAVSDQRDAAVSELRQVTLELQNTRTTLQSKVKNLEKELNNTREAARTTISNLEMDNAAHIARMEREVHEANERAEKEIAETRAAFESASAKLTKETNETVQAILESTTENINRIQQERDKRIAQMQETISELQSIRKIESEQMMQETELIVASLRAEALKNVSDIQIKAENEISHVKRESAEIISQLRLELSSTKADAVASLQSLQEEAFHNASAIMEDANQKIAAVEKDRDEQITQLKNLLNATKDKASSDLIALKEEANNELAKNRKDAAHELTQVKREHEKVVADLKKKFKNLKKKFKKMGSANKELASNYHGAREDVARWEKLHSERSYCNLTHVHEDARSAIAHASRVALENAVFMAERASVHFSVASKHVTRVAKEITDKAFVAAAPHIQRSRELYDQHLKVHVDKVCQHHETYVLPVHEKFILPLIPVVVLYATKAHDTLQLTSEKFFSALVAAFKGACPLAAKQLQMMEKRSRYFNGLAEPVEQSCRNPEDAVASLLVTLVLIFTFIFRRTLGKVATKVLLLPIRILWFFNPLQLIKRKKNKKPEAAANGVVGKKNKAE